jgi:integrase
MRYTEADHLKRNRFGLWYWRRVIPHDVRDFFALKEVARSMRTTDRKEAAARARRYSTMLDLLFERLRLAKKKDTIQTDYKVIFDFGEDGSLKSMLADVKPGEEASANKVIPELLQAARGAPASTAQGGPTLFAEIAKYLDEQTKGGGWSAQTALDARGDFEQFKQVLGDMPVAALSHEPLNKLKDVLLRLPANINKLPQTRGKSVDEILALGLPAQSPLTVRKKWDRLTSFFDWLEGKGLIGRNFARGKKPRAKPQSYEKLSNDDLSRLFESEEYATGQFHEPFQFWLPLLGLYTGARLGELAQLHLTDLRQDESGIWFVEITEETDDNGGDSDKKLKNKSSQRKCPLHRALVEAGLLTYAAELRQAGYTRLFPELIPDALGKVSGRASEWFTEYRRAKGVGALAGRSRKAFHSLRHTMVAALQRAGVEQEYREALAGHASKAINIRVYGGPHFLAYLQTAIEKLDYGIRTPAFQSTERHQRARLKAQARSRSS